jgi:hypothetical protein
MSPVWKRIATFAARFPQAWEEGSTKRRTENSEKQVFERERIW